MVNRQLHVISFSCAPEKKQENQKEIKNDSIAAAAVEDESAKGESQCVSVKASTYSHDFSEVAQIKAM